MDVNLESAIYIWYKIKVDSNNEGWIASHRKKPYLIDHNNPNDIVTPVLKFKEDKYFVDSIEDINYDYLEVWDDKEGYTVTHKVYKEITKDNEIHY